MKKRYIITYLLLVLLSAIALILYIKIENENIQNIFGNISAGMITGLIIAILSNIKNKYIYENTMKMKKYQSIIDKSHNIIITQINLQTKSEITVLELIYLYSDIYNNIKDYYEIEEKNIKIGFNKTKYKWEEIDINTNKRIAELSDIMYENIMSIDKYKSEYQLELGEIIADMHILQIYLKKDLEFIVNDTEKLSKSII